MWTPGPFESKPSRAYYYLTDVDSQLVTRSSEGTPVATSNIPTLWNISIHEVYPGQLPALPSSSSGCFKGAEVDAVRSSIVRRGLGALLRAHDGGSRLPPR
jgi:hypothetical protein